jgi:glycosyltransferase involved in cell wall biosynthesis
LFDLYENYDNLIFSSLQDSGCFVVREALSYGIPVICFDFGDPRDIVSHNSGVIAKTSGLDTTQVASRIAREKWDLFGSPIT